MSRHYPIWNDVTACNYKGSKSWGSVKDMTLNQYIGSSAKNSHLFAEIITTKREVIDSDGNKQIIFRLSVDGAMIKEALFSTNHNGNADDLLHIAPV
jgi:hypothetical protein